MAIEIIGGASYNNGGDGIHVEGGQDVHVKDVDTYGNGGHGVNIITPDGHTLDTETKQLLIELRTALAAQDKSVVKKILNTLTDKSLDLIVALIAGKFFSKS